MWTFIRWNIGIGLCKKVSRKSEFKIVKDSSHEVNVDNPKELAHIIYDFWKEFL